MHIEAFPDTTGYAPKGETWHAYNCDTYDGAEDAGHQLVGYGENAAEAVFHLIELMLDEGEITRERAEALCLEFSIYPGRLAE